MRGNADLPFASTLCGSCSNVCPVKIDIHEQLWKWRQVLTDEGYVTFGKKWGMKALSLVVSSPSIYRISGKMGRWIMRHFPSLLANKTVNPWYKQRDMPDAPGQSFRTWYLKNKK